MRFYAGRREPPRGNAFFSVAQFDATSPCHGFMAVTVACRGRNTLQACRHVAIDGDDRQQCEDNYSGQANIEGAMGNDGQKQRVHDSCCGDSAQKPIGQQVTKNHY
jgi:hypothetical protein